MNPSTINNSHEYIFQTYNELKRILPNGFLKMKVLKKQRYPVNESSIINEIEKNYSNKNINKNLYSSQNINIFYNDEETENKITKILPQIRTRITDEYSNVSKTRSQNNDTNLNNSSSEIITYRNFREKNMKMIGVSCDVKLKRNKGLYNSVSVNDIDMKKNIYLPRIIDRMKYSIPRNLRNNKGFILCGNNEDKLINKYKELNFIRNKNDIPTDMFFYKEGKKTKTRNKDKNIKNKKNKEKSKINNIKVNVINENNKNNVNKDNTDDLKKE